MSFYREERPEQRQGQYDAITSSAPNPWRRQAMPGVVTMRLAGGGERDVCSNTEYLIYDKQAPERDYLVDFNVRLVGMAPLDGQPDLAIGIDWSERLVPEREGVPEREHVHDAGLPFSGRKFDRGAGYERRRQGRRAYRSAVNWVAFKQQFFSSVFIAPRERPPAPTWPYDTCGVPARSCSRVPAARWLCPTTAQAERIRLRILLRSQQVRDR